MSASSRSRKARARRKAARVERVRAEERFYKEAVAKLSADFIVNGMFFKGGKVTLMTGIQGYEVTDELYESLSKTPAALAALGLKKEPDE